MICVGYTAYMDSSNKFFIWTEAAGCGEILPPCLESYMKHHKEKIHVFGYPEDFVNVPKSRQIIPMVIQDQPTQLGQGMDLSFEKDLRDAYQHGHEGTAFLWAKIIANRTEDFLLHLDSDTVFLGDVVSPIIAQLESGYGVVGTRRPYKEQVRNGNVKGYRRFQFYFYRDAVNTYAFGFDRRSIKLKSFQDIQDKIRAKYSSRILQRIFPVIDFFDSLTFRLARTKGIFYLDSYNQAKSGKHGRYGEFESLMISFAAVGSGCNFYKNPQVQTSESYREFALASFSLYSKYLLDKEIGVNPLDSPYLVNLLEKLDKKTWTLNGI
jgi:hypothetical protein